MDLACSLHEDTRYRCSGVIISVVKTIFHGILVPRFLNLGTLFVAETIGVVIPGRV
jgi:hypothetical protein